MKQKRSRVLRVLLPALIVVAWIAITGIGGPYFGRVSEVSSNDPAAYLPDTAESTQVNARLPEFRGSNLIPAVVVIEHGKPSAETESWLTGLPERLEQVDGVVPPVSPPIPSEDGQAVQMFVGLDGDSPVRGAVTEMRETLHGSAPAGVKAHVTGPAGFTTDLVNGFAGVDGLLLLVACSVVFVILVLVHRAVLLPILVLLTSIAALTASLLTVWWAAKFDWLSLSGQTQGILFILVIGATTDYALLYVERFREEIHRNPTRLDATLAAWRGTVVPIVASGATVIVGVLCLLLSQLDSNRSLGPIATVGILFAIGSALTLLPALLLLAGQIAFWPGTFHHADASDKPGLWERLPGWIEKRHRAIWIGIFVVLTIASVNAVSLKADGVPTSELVLSKSDARDGQNVLADHFADGSGSPLQLLVPESRLDDVAELLAARNDIDGISVAAKDLPGGEIRFVEGHFAADDVKPTVSDGMVLMSATPSAAADSLAAEQTVKEVRAEVPAGVLVGGVSAIDLDTNTASAADRNLIIPTILLAVFVLLVIILRSLVAPIVLLLTVVVSFGATLGVAAFLFNQVLDLPGADPAVPLYGFVFLVALGVDYNIFLMTRVHEEAREIGALAGMRRGLTVTGSVITSAGIVLAATFAALSVLPILFLVQLSFIVAFGVLLDTLIVRSLLVPALGFELGDKLWWPSRLPVSRQSLQL